MSSDQVREAFEHWFSDGGEHPLACQRAADGGYLLAQAESSWTAWQAASASHAAEVEALRKALTKLCTQFPTDHDMAAAGWGTTEINEACNAYDAARAALKGD
jgi:multidrug resistance efflux pump